MKTGKMIAALMALALVFSNQVANAEPSATLKVGGLRRISICPTRTAKSTLWGIFEGSGWPCISM